MVPDPAEARFDGRTLFVRGTRSAYVPDEVLPIIGRFFPRFDVVDIEAGHWVTSEKPEEFRKGEFFAAYVWVGRVVVNMLTVT